MKIFLVVILLTLSSFSLSAKKVSIDIDAATFRFDDNNIVWELYYSFPDTTLKYIYQSGKYIGEMEVSILIKSNIDTILTDQWDIQNSSSKAITEYKTGLFGMKSFQLKPGQFEIDLKFRDKNDSTTTAGKKFKLILSSFPNDKLAMSDIQLARLIESADTKAAKWNKMFYKNSLYVIPNPSLEFFAKEPVLKAYLEVYNARKVCPEGYNIYFRILDNNKKIIATTPGETNAVSDGLVEIVEFPLDPLPTGMYYLQVKIAYPSSKEKDSISVFKKFYFIDPDKPPVQEAGFIENLTFEGSEFSTYTPEQVELEYEKILYIANPLEKDKYEMLETQEAKQRFLFAFWQNRDPDPKTPFNEKLNDFREAEEFANRYFSYGNMKEGWRTDRGRILLKYGFPTQRDRVAADKEVRAYEVWHFDTIQGGLRFYFVDKAGYNKYIMVHSTSPGEIYNENWFKEDAVIPGTDFDTIESNPYLR